MTELETARPPLPPFTRETALAKVRAAEDAWNSRDPERVVACLHGRQRMAKPRPVRHRPPRDRRIPAGKWAREEDYRLVKELWGFLGNRMAVRFQYECRIAGQWYRCYGNELWEFADNGLMRRREASINDRQIAEADRRFRWDAASPRPLDHPGIPGVDD